MLTALELLLRHIEDEWEGTDAPILQLAKDVRKELNQPRDEEPLDK